MSSCSRSPSMRAARAGGEQRNTLPRPGVVAGELSIQSIDGEFKGSAVLAPPQFPGIVGGTAFKPRKFTANRCNATSRGFARSLGAMVLAERTTHPNRLQRSAVAADPLAHEDAVFVGHGTK